METPFALEALVDFPDDALTTTQPITPKRIDAMMARLAALGVQTVIWAYYGDGHGGYVIPTGLDEPNTHWGNYAATCKLLGNPLRVAAEAAHRHGLKIHAYYKPYETGPAGVLPEGSPEAKQWGRLGQIGGQLFWLDPFVVKHPQLRIRRRMDDAPAGKLDAPIAGIRLVKRDASPTRISKDHLQIWTSDSNYRYERRDVAFQLSDAVVPATHDVRDWVGALLTRKGDPVRVLTLSGLQLTDRYVLLTTDFTDGTSDFVNSGTELMVALDAEGREILGVFSDGGAIWTSRLIDFRNQGLVFDLGFTRNPVTLDAPNTSGKRGLVAFARGRNEYLPGALCETEPAVQRFWLSCIREMLDAGVDGVDFREENHSTHTDYPDEYGFNTAVMKQLKGARGPGLPAEIARVRGAAYTTFLRKAKRLIASRGKRMRINLNVDYYRPDPPPHRLLAYPANIAFDWHKWVEDGLLDEAVIRIFALPFDAIFTDPVAQDMVVQCRQRGIPIVVNRYLQPRDQYLAEFRRVHEDGRFSGFILYETASFLAFGPDDTCRVTAPVVEEVSRLTPRGK